ncbi:MAG: hypothetical protein U5K54_28780 [Cytophagales bacterium]|nr:hypothetical protein [Cytophagales bacterium]
MVGFKFNKKVFAAHWSRLATSFRSGRSYFKDVAAQTEILKEGQHVTMIPLVLEGLIKVYTRNEERTSPLLY